MTLAEFLDKITVDSSPASLLVDIAETMSNPCDLPYVVHKLQIILSKLSIALIPMIDGGGIVLYRVEVHEVVKKVAKQVTETVTEVRSKWVKRTKTVYRRVAKRIRVWRKLVKWVRECKVITFRYWVPWHWVTVRQVYYVWVPKIQWKAFWKTIYETVKETVTYWVKVTETVTKTVTKTVYETVKETVKKNVNVYRVKVLEGKVVDLKTKKEYDMAEWLLTLIGVDVKALKDMAKDEKNPMGSLSSSFTKLMAPFVDVILAVKDILVEWFSTWFIQIAYAFTAQLLAEMYENTWKRDMEYMCDGGGKNPEKLRYQYLWQKYDEFDLIKSLSPIYWAWKDERAEKTWYIAQSTYLMPKVAKIHLMLTGDSVFIVPYTTEKLVKLEDGGVIWINCRNLRIEKDENGRWRAYTWVEEENGEFARKEIVKDLSVTRRVMLTYYMEDEELRAIPMVYLGKGDVELNGEESKIIDDAIKNVEDVGKAFKVVENNKGNAEIIAITDPRNIMKEPNTKNYELNTVYCIEQLLDMKAATRDFDKIPDVLKCDEARWEKLDAVLKAYAEKLGDAIGDAHPCGGRVINAMYMDFETESGIKLSSLPDPYYAGRSATFHGNPELLGGLLQGDENAIKILELAGGYYYKNEKRKWKYEPGKIIFRYYFNWKRSLERDSPVAATLWAFCHDVSIAELKSKHYEVDENTKIYVGEADGERVKATIKELIELRDKMEKVRERYKQEHGGQTKGWTKEFLGKHATSEEIKLVRAVTKTGEDLDLKMSMGRPVDLGSEVIMKVRLPDQVGCSSTLFSTFALRNIVDNLDISVPVIKKDGDVFSDYVKTKDGKTNPWKAWLANKAVEHVAICEYYIMLMDKEIDELKNEKSELDKLKSENLEIKEKMAKIEIAIKDLANLKNRLADGNENAKKFFRKATIESLEELGKMSVKQAMRGYVMYLAGLLLTLGACHWH